MWGGDRRKAIIEIWRDTFKTHKQRGWKFIEILYIKRKAN